MHSALYASEALVLLLSPSLRQSGELFKKALACLRATEAPTETAAESALRFELENGSRIESFSLLKILLEAGQLHLPRVPEARQLANDLKDYELRTEEADGRLEGAFRVGHATSW